MDDVKWLDDTEEQAWRGYQRMRTLLTAQLARDLVSDSGLSEPDYTVLSNLSEAEGHRWRLNELAARDAAVEEPSFAPPRGMEDRGLVVREECSTDGRGAFVVLTKAGLRAIRGGCAAACALGPPQPHRCAESRRDRRWLATITQKVVAHLSRPTAPA